MTAGDWIQGVALFIAIVSLVIGQWRQYGELAKVSKRDSYKLKIFFLCQDDEKSFDEIVGHFRGMGPGESIDELEIRKAVYEMLADQTLRYRTNSTFRARRNQANDGGKPDDA